MSPATPDTLLKTKDPVLASYLDGSLKGLVEVCIVDRVYNHDVDVLRFCESLPDVDFILLMGQVEPRENGVYAIQEDGRLQRQHLITQWHGGYVRSPRGDQRYVCLSPPERDVEGVSPLLFVKF